MPPTKQSNVILLKLSAIGCLVAMLVFVSFLFLGGPVHHEAQAANYTAEQIIQAVNQERINKGLKALVLNDKLMEAADRKVQDMSSKGYFSHISPIDGKKWSDFIKESNYEYSIAGENLANGFNDVGPMVQAWMNSPSHRENILNRQVEETGVGVSQPVIFNNYLTFFVVQVFGKQMTVKESQNLEEKKSEVQHREKEKAQKEETEETLAPDENGEAKSLEKNEKNEEKSQEEEMKKNETDLDIGESKEGQKSDQEAKLIDNPKKKSIGSLIEVPRLGS